MISKLPSGGWKVNCNFCNKELLYPENCSHFILISKLQEIGWRRIKNKVDKSYDVHEDACATCERTVVCNN